MTDTARILISNKGSIAGLVHRALAGSGVRLAGIPVVAGVGLYNTSLIVGETGAVSYGIVNTIATLGALLPFADLGIGGSVTTAVALRHQDGTRRGLRVQERVVAAYRALLLVAAALCAFSVAIGVLSLWDDILGQTFSPVEQSLISACLIIFAFGIPCGLGARMLVGLGRNTLAVAIGMTSSLFTLATTVSLTLLDVTDMAFALSGFAGGLIANSVATLLALRLIRQDGIRIPFPLKKGYHFTHGRLLAGSGWLFVVTIGLPVGLETGRIVLSHVSSPHELSEFALMSQIYVLTWSVISTSAGALWTIFAQAREDAKGSYRIWRLMVAIFGIGSLVAGVLLWQAGPWIGSVISGGRIDVGQGTAAAFAVLLLAQSLHLPAGSLLTRPRELRYQAICVALMAIVSLSLGISMAPTHGSMAIPVGAATGVFLGQFIPDLFFVRRYLFGSDRGGFG